MLSARTLHYVFKIGNRKQSIDFFKSILLMKVLRHEEFKEGCEASCNGPYDGAWSKTMIGYGSEDDHFVIELTYNYGISTYAHGNDFQAIHIKRKDLFTSISAGSYPFSNISGRIELNSPCGYKFIIHNEEPKTKDPVYQCSLSCTDLQASHKFWHDILKMKCLTQNDQELVLTYGDDQCLLKLEKIDVPMDHAKAYGRIAFSAPTRMLGDIENAAKSNESTILKPLVGLDTPGKARVYVVILADPDGHEICFVGDEAFRELSQFDPEADKLLEEAMLADKSDEWFSKRTGKASA